MVTDSAESKTLTTSVNNLLFTEHESNTVLEFLKYQTYVSRIILNGCYQIGTFQKLHYIVSFSLLSTRVVQNNDPLLDARIHECVTIKFHLSTNRQHIYHC